MFMQASLYLYLHFYLLAADFKVFIDFPLYLAAFRFGLATLEVQASSTVLDFVITIQVYTFILL